MGAEPGRGDSAWSIHGSQHSSNTVSCRAQPIGEAHGEQSDDEATEVSDASNDDGTARIMEAVASVEMHQIRNELTKIRVFITAILLLTVALWISDLVRVGLMARLFGTL